MNTNMTGFRCVFNNLCIRVFWTKVASVCAGLQSSIFGQLGCAVLSLIPKFSTRVLSTLLKVSIKSKNISDLTVC